MSGLVYYTLDTETTGLSSSYHEITEIGIVREQDRHQLWRKIKCSFPERASYDALKITNKTIADLLQGDNLEDVINECEKFFNEDGLTPAHRVIVAHNASFDRKMVHAHWAKLGKAFPAHLWLDTIKMVKSYIKTNGIDKYAKDRGLPKPKVNLHASLDLLQIKKLADSHNAKVDSRNTYLLKKGCIEKGVDHLPLIETHIHSLESIEEGGLDPDLLD